MAGRIFYSPEEIQVMFSPPSGGLSIEEARLLAAAPKLLAACKVLVDLWEADEEPADIERDALIPAKAAILEAQGGYP